MISYILKAHLLLMISYLIFHYLLKSNHNYQINRYYLLSSLVLSVFVPVIPLEQLPNVLNSNTLSAYILPEIESVIKIPTESFSTIYNSNGFQIVLILYWSIAAILVLISFYRIVKLLTYCKELRQQAIIVENNIFYTRQNIRPFSFLGNIYIYNQLLEDPNSLMVVKRHEQSHIRAYHSLDLILIELINSLFFLNLFQTKLRRSIQENHEYLADKAALKEITVGQYIKVMIENTVQGLYPKYVNHFSKPLIMKRLAMLKKESKTNYSSVLFSITIFAFSIILVSCNWNKTYEELAKEATSESDQIFTIIDSQAVPYGGIQAYYNKISAFMQEELASFQLTEELEGVCYVQFVIEKNGSLSEIKTVKGINQEIDKMVERSVLNAGEWLPGSHKGEIVRSIRVLPVRINL